MILKYSIAIVWLFLLTLSACQRTPAPVDSSSKVGESEVDPALKPGGPPVHQPLSEEEQAEGSVAQTNTVTPEKKPKPVATQTEGNNASSSEILKPAPQGTASVDDSGTPTVKPDSASADTSSASASTSGDASIAPSQRPIPLLKDEMEKTKFTVKQLVDSGLLGEGGSNAYYSYMTYMLNKADSALKQSIRGQKATDLFFLCNKDLSDCIKNGLSLDKLDKPMIMRLIHVAGRASSKFYKTEDNESFFVLQGEQVTQDFIKDTMKRMEQAGANKILVNLSQMQSWNDLGWFFDFGSQLKKKKIDLHIVGQCSSLCANYSIPAANKVVIEPYGYIFYDGNFSGLFQDIKTVYSIQVENNRKQFYQEHFSQNEVTGLMDFFYQYSGNLRVIMIFDQTVVGNSLNQVSRILAENRVPSFWDLSREGQRSLLSKIRQESRDDLKTFFFNLSESTRTITGYYNSIQQVAQAEANYYKAQAIPESQKDYSYLDFINLTSWLTRNMSYAQLFSLPRSHYKVPEKDKPYVAVFPSADILKYSGINIEGENNKKVLHTLYEDSENIFLFLSADDMENCDFFVAKMASFTTETLQKCLSQDGSLL